MHTVHSLIGQMEDHLWLLAAGSDRRKCFASAIGGNWSTGMIEIAGFIGLHRKTGEGENRSLISCSLRRSMNLKRLKKRRRVKELPTSDCWHGCQSVLQPIIFSILLVYFIFVVVLAVDLVILTGGAQNGDTQTKMFWTNVRKLDWVVIPSKSGRRARNRPRIKWGDFGLRGWGQEAGEK